MPSRFARSVPIAAVVACLASPLAASRQASAQDPSATTGIDTSRFDLIRPTIERAIADKKLPGAVVLVGRGNRVLYEKAVGNRSIEPAVEPMTLDTIFDLASLTKVIATTTSVMKLMEDGRIRMNDRVAAFIPGFERYGKADITIRHLMTHTSGLRPDLDLADAWAGPDVAIDLAIEEVPTSSAGRAFRLQRHQLHFARRHRPSRERSAAERVRAETDLRAAGDEGHDVPAAGIVAAAHRADREVHTVWLAVRGLEPADAARRRARSDGQADGWCCRSRGTLWHRCGRLDLLPDAAEQGHVQRARA